VTAFDLNDTVSVHDGTRRTIGVVVQILAGRLLVIELGDGRRVRRHSA
jgi:hypothetical protein